MRHLRATSRTAYCGADLREERSTRFHLLVTCGRCHTVERFYAHMGFDPAGWQHETMALLMKRADPTYTHRRVVRAPRKR